MNVWRYRARLVEVLDAGLYRVVLDLVNCNPGHPLHWHITIRLAGVSVVRKDSPDWRERELAPVLSDFVRVSLTQTMIPGAAGPDFDANWNLVVQTLGRTCEAGHQLALVGYFDGAEGWVDLGEELVKRKLARKVPRQR